MITHKKKHTISTQIWKAVWLSDYHFSRANRYKSTVIKPTQTKKVWTYYTARIFSSKLWFRAAYDALAEVWLPSLAVRIFDASLYLMSEKWSLWWSNFEREFSADKGH